MSTDTPPGQWTVDTLHAYVDLQIFSLRAEADLRNKMLDERKSTADEAGKVALAAQQTAMRTALEAAEKAVQTALVSAEKAVNKAELAADKRFESVNEFRQQLADLIATFISRVEVEIRFTSLTEKVESLSGANTERVAELTTSLGRQIADLSSRISQLPTRSELESHASANAARITTLESRLDKIEGRTIGDADAKSAIQTSQAAKRSQVQLGIAALAIIVTIILGIVAFQIGINSAKNNEIISVPAVVSTTTATR